MLVLVLKKMLYLWRQQDANNMISADSPHCWFSILKSSDQENDWLKTANLPGVASILPNIWVQESWDIILRTQCVTTE